MINLNKNIINLHLNPLIIFKLKKLEFTKIGDLIMTSYPELFYTKLFTNEQLESIQNSLNKLCLDYVSEIDLSNISYLKKELLSFCFNEYQEKLYQNHHKTYDETKIEPLIYSDSINIVKKLLFMYEQTYSKKIEPDTKILLDNFLKKYPYMTIADFVDIYPNEIDLSIINLIGEVLGLPINRKLSHDRLIARENRIFNQENVQSEKIQLYIDNFSSNEKIENFIKKSKGKTFKKTITKNH